MGKFIPVNADRPSDVKFINLDCIVAFADFGDGRRTKLYMDSGLQITIFMPYLHFVEMVTSVSSDE